MLTNQMKNQIRDSLRKWASSHQEIGKQIESATSELANILELDQTGEMKYSDRLIVDSTTFTISWNGHSCQLGNTLLFWFSSACSFHE
ncbi:hypothetical protein [Gimesia sp.]|uniref:hypothetical protein n=1 Tax=Gimesia sp. TaxID=2024833 RepID=UPI003A950352